jgi:hypothetical protein
VASLVDFPQPGADDHLLILFYNSFFGTPPAQVDCGPEHTLTTDRSLLPDADAVVFHLPGAREIGDARKYPGQTWVAWSMESTIHTPMMDQPELMRHFDLTMTFSPRSDVWYGYMAQRSMWEAALARPLPRRRHANPLVMFQSATVDRCGRNAFCAELMQLMPVDSYGRFLHNRELDIPDRGPETKSEVIGSYKFALGAENTFETDYVTEKFFQPLLAGTVPVYRGAPNVADFAPGERCFIDANAFASTRELAEYLTHLDHDDAEYATYHAWRTQPLRPSFERLLDICEKAAFCRLAELLVQRGPATGRGSLMPFGPTRYAEAKLILAVRAARAFRAALARPGAPGTV